MRILLIATNKHQRLMSRMNAFPAPIGLAYIAGYLDPERHDVKILDLMFSEDYLDETERVVREFKPDLIGISLRNLDNVSYMDPQWTLPGPKEVIDKVRSITEAPIVCGGPGFSLLPEACFDYLEPDLAWLSCPGLPYAPKSVRPPMCAANLHMVHFSIELFRLSWNFQNCCCKQEISPSRSFSVRPIFNLFSENYFP